jgi:hypothetical protein
MNDFVTSCLNDFAPCSGGCRTEEFNLSLIGRLTSLKSVRSFLPGLNLFFNQINLNLPEIISFEKKTESKNIKKLKNFFNHFGSDKSSSHSYHKVYGYFFKKINRYKKLKILEIGLGSNNPNIVSFMPSEFKPGSSLRALKSFFPNAEIFGADIDKEILFKEERIKTSFVDQLDFSSFFKMHENFNSPEYDIIIEDGLHSLSSSLNTLVFALQKIKNNGLIFLEDLNNPNNEWGIITFLLCQSGYYAKLIESRGLILVISKNKKMFSR